MAFVPLAPPLSLNMQRVGAPWTGAPPAPAVCGGLLASRGPTPAGPHVRGGPPVCGGPPRRGRHGASLPMLPAARGLPWAVPRMAAGPADRDAPGSAAASDADRSGRPTPPIEGAVGGLGKGASSVAGGGSPPRRRRRQSLSRPSDNADRGDAAASRGTTPSRPAVAAATAASDPTPAATVPARSYHQSTASNAARAAAMRALWADPAYRERMAARRRRGLGRFPTRPRRDPNAPRRPVGRPRGAAGAAKAAAASTAAAAAAAAADASVAAAAGEDPLVVGDAGAPSPPLRRPPSPPKRGGPPTPPT